MESEHENQGSHTRDSVEIESFSGVRGDERPAKKGKTVFPESSEVESFGGVRDDKQVTEKGKTVFSDSPVLPKDVLKLIFGQCGGMELIRLRAVCRKWRLLCWEALLCTHAVAFFREEECSCMLHSRREICQCRPSELRIFHRTTALCLFSKPIFKDENSSISASEGLDIKNAWFYEYRGNGDIVVLVRVSLLGGFTLESVEVTETVSQYNGTPSLYMHSTGVYLVSEGSIWTSDRDAGGYEIFYEQEGLGIYPSKVETCPGAVFSLVEDKITVIHSKESIFQLEGSFDSLRRCGEQIAVRLKSDLELRVWHILDAKGEKKLELALRERAEIIGFLHGRIVSETKRYEHTMWVHGDGSVVLFSIKAYHSEGERLLLVPGMGFFLDGDERQTQFRIVSPNMEGYATVKGPEVRMGSYHFGLN